MNRGQLLRDIHKIYPYYNLDRFSDRALSCIHTKVLSESIDTRVKKYNNFLDNTNDIDMYHDVKSLLININ